MTASSPSQRRAVFSPERLVVARAAFRDAQHSLDAARVELLEAARPGLPASG